MNRTVIALKATRLSNVILSVLIREITKGAGELKERLLIPLSKEDRLPKAKIMNS